MRNPFELEHLRALPIGWWGAVAGAAVAGATLFPETRVLAGGAAAAAMLLLALKLTPCCAGCAAGAGCGSSPTTGTRGESPGELESLARGDDVQAPFTDGTSSFDVRVLLDQAQAARTYSGCS